VVQVAQELRLYRQSWGIQKQIERANQELALINMVEINYYELGNRQGVHRVYNIANYPKITIWPVPNGL
jgi:hypothetical protein